MAKSDGDATAAALTAAEARRQAVEAYGGGRLDASPISSKNASGFKCVQQDRSRRSRPSYTGTDVGTFATAEEAALAVARADREAGGRMRHAAARHRRSHARRGAAAGGSGGTD